MLDIKWIRDNQDAFLKGLTDRGFDDPERDLESNSEPGRGTARDDSEIAGGAGAPQRRLQGDRPGHGEKDEAVAEAPEGRGRAAQERDPRGRGRGDARWTTNSGPSWRQFPTIPPPTCRSAPTPAPMSSCAKSARAKVQLHAEAAFRARRSARADGFRDGGETVRRALRRPERTAGAARTRPRPVHARPAQLRQSTAIPRSTRRFSCATTPCSARPNCRSSRRTSSRL